MILLKGFVDGESDESDGTREIPESILRKLREINSRHLNSFSF